MERSEMRERPSNPHHRSRISLRFIRATGFAKWQSRARAFAHPTTLQADLSHGR